VKILHVIHSVDPRGGGPIEGIRQLSAALVALGHQVGVMSLDAPDTPWAADFPLPFFPIGSGKRGYGYASGVVAWLIAHADDYDVILVNGLWQFGGYATWLATRKTGKSYCVYTHGMLDPWFKRRYPLKHLKKWLYWPWGEYRVLRDAAAVFFTCEEERREARKSFWLYHCRECVLGYGISAPPVEAEAQQELFRQTFPTLAEKRLLLFLGRMHEKKGCDLLLRAWAESASGLHLVMAGPCDNAYGLSMKELAEKLGLTDRITWTGMIQGDLKWGAFRSSEAFILPSHQENFGISVVEALACSLPVLISDKVNIWREIVEDGAGLTEDDTPAGTQRLLVRWDALSEEERFIMGSRALACFQARFQVEGVARHLIETLHGVITT
jgi:glycosyltransferase involved in cell wall biosynthesis